MERNAIGVNSNRQSLATAAGAVCRAFTLVELLVTMALMGLLATISSVGYYAAVRGMNDRSAHQIAVSTLRFAMQRALIDDLPVAVFFTDETINTANEDALEDGKVVGRITVVRMGGRISYVGQNGKEIVDEFADWGSTYPREREYLGSSSRPTTKMYRLAPSGSGMENSESKYLSHVTEYVYEVEKENQETLLASNLALQRWHKNKADFRGNGNSGFKQNSVQFAPFFGFKVEKGFSDWNVGDAYGFEIAQMQLPDGYLFSRDSVDEYGRAKSKVGDINTVATVFLNPSAAKADATTVPMQGKSQISIYAYRLKQGMKAIGSPITENDLKD